MSKVITGIAELGAAAGLMTAAFFDPMLAFSPAFWKITVGLAFAGASSELGAALGALTAAGGTAITTRQSAAYRPICYGTRQVPGALIYQSTTGGKHDQDNQIIVLCGHEIDSIESLYLDGRKVFWQVGSGGNITRNGVNFGGSADDNTYIGSDGSHYKFGGLVYCEPRFGDQADGDVISGMTANDPTWAAGTNGSPSVMGCAYVYLKCEYDQSMFPQRPECRFVVRGKNNIWDPRTNTYGYTNNWALCIADVLMNTDYGLGVPQAAINVDQLIAAANVCDEQVACAEGMEARYTCNWVGDTSTTTGDILKQMISSAAGRITYANGQWYIFPAYWQGPSSSWDASALIDGIRYTPNRSIRELCNRVSGTYIAPWYPYNVSGNLYDQNGWFDGTIANTFNLAWQPTDFPYYAQDTLHGYTSDKWLAEDGGRIIYKDLSLPACISISQAQRVAKITLLRNRFQQSATLSMNLAAYQLMPLDTIELTYPLLGWNNKVFEVTGVRLAVDSQAGQDDKSKAPRVYVQVDIQETDSSIYDWSELEELKVNDVPAIGGGIPYIVPPPTNLALSHQSVSFGALASGSGILISWTPSSDAYVTSTAIQYSSDGGTTWTSGGSVPQGNSQSGIAPLPSGDYTVEIAAVRSNGAMSTWISASISF